MLTNFKKSSFWKALQQRYNSFMKRRPHRSFRLTRRRDYLRPLELPGNIAFTYEVTQTLWRYKKTFLLLALVYIVLFALLVGMQSQETYALLTETLKSTSENVFSGNWGEVGEAGLLLLALASSGVNTEATQAQQLFSLFIFLLIWLTTVWLLRNMLAGHKVKLRDGLYNSGAPLFATILVTLFIALQLIPIAVSFIGYNAASTSGLIAAGGAAAMLFWMGAGALTLLSLYWIISSLFAMIIVTLPGMYPYVAIRTAGDMVLGRRVKILLRWLWMVLMIILAWVVIVIPIILLDMGLKSVWPAIEWLPIVPVTTLVMAALTTVWTASYVYLLYRKVVDYAPKA
jgi:hypothetical protein